MANITQANQPIELLSPLGKDVLLITSFSGEEALSQLFQFEVDMIADAKKEIAFDKILGQMVAIRLNSAGGKPRYFHGICSRFRQGDADADFISYHLEMVPQTWLLTKRTQTRIFQQMSVPDILKKVMTGLDVAYQIEGTFHPRNYCVQYRESDFSFVSRLMEEEGIFYFFVHTAEGHKMVLANTPGSHPDMPLNSKLSFEKAMINKWVEDRILTWEKQQELVTANHTIWDHKFEMHGKNLEAKNTVVDSIQVGKVTHKVKAGGADNREVYEYPGSFAHRFDGINPGGGEQAAELKKILQDNERVAGIRSQQEAVRSVKIQGTSTCRNLMPGHKFSLQKHGSGDGDYVLTSVIHHATTPIDYRSNKNDFKYQNTITAIPFSLAYRPLRSTPKPVVQGTQTAIVVGPKNDEIFCDKYGRVKVQFHWDREGQRDARSSCWIRVATNWAGKHFGMICVPRIGQEVIVGFEEGDPDRPIIIGSVFNADHMPPADLPKTKMVSGLKSNSTPKGGGYNGLTFDDTKGKENIVLHAQYDMNTTIEHDENHTVHNNRTTTVDVNHKETVTGKQESTVDGAVIEIYNANQSTTVKNAVEITSTAANVKIVAATEILLSCGASSLLLQKDGTIKLSGVNLEIKGTATLVTDSPATNINGKDIGIAGSATVMMGTGSNGVATDTSSVTMSGAKVVSHADGNNEITGGLVKIN